MKKILGLTIAALLVMALVGGGTWAYFSDVEAATDILTAGTIDLEGSGSWTSGLTLTDMTPGDIITTVTFKNVGSLTSNLTFTEANLGPDDDDVRDAYEPSVFEWSANGTITPNPDNEMSAEEYQKLIFVTMVDDTAGDGLSLITEAGLSSKNSDGYISLYELVNNTATVAILPEWTSDESITMTFYLGDAFNDLAKTGAAPVDWTTYLVTADGDPTSHFYILEGAAEVAWNVPQADGLTMDIIATLTQQ